MRSGIVDSFVRSLHVVFMVGIPLAALAFVCALLLKDAPLHGTVAKDRDASEPDLVAQRPGAAVAPVPASAAAARRS